MKKLLYLILILIVVAFSETDAEITRGFDTQNKSIAVNDLLNIQDVSREAQGQISPKNNTISSLCLVTINPTRMSFSANANNGTINIIPEDPACQDWNAASNVPWITVTEPSTGFGSGSNQVKYSVQANTGTSQRTGAINISNKIFEVTQAGAVNCVINPSSTSTSFSASGGHGSITVTTSSSCSWTATVSANTSWITILSGASGTGNGQVVFSVANYTGTSRRVGTITVGNVVFTITQEGATPSTCTYDITSQTTNLAYQASTNNVYTVTTNISTCTWTVVSMANWLTITSGSTGTGNGIGKFSVTQNTGTTSRSTELKILGTSSSITITQSAKPSEPTCEITLDPTSYTVDYKGGTSAFNIATNLTNCYWTASTDDDWITISATTSSGTGNGKVSFTVSQNLSTTTRTGRIIVSGQEFKITQSGFSGDTTNLGNAVDNTSLTWTSGGNLPFYVDTQDYYYGGSSARSGPLADSQSSWIQTTVIGPGNLSFYWKVLSEAGFDTLKFTLNGIRYAEISGSIDWRRFTMEIPEGSHSLRWTYSKDSAGSSGLDAGWLDKVEYVYTGPPPQKIVPLHRFYNATSGAHFYTADEREKEEVKQRFPEFTYEGIAYYVYSSRELYTAPVHRFYNTRTRVHFYTIDESEKDTIIRMFPYFNYEGIAFYAFPIRVDYSKPIYRFFNSKTGTHFYTIYESEKDFVIQNYPDWRYEFVSYFAIN